MGCSAVLKKENPLPSAERQSAVHNGNHFGCSGQSHAQVTGHIISTFVRVDKIWRFLRHQPIKKLMQVRPRRGVSVFEDQQAATGVLDKDRRSASAYPAGGDQSLAGIGDLVGALASRLDTETVSEGSHELRCGRWTRFLLGLILVRHLHLHPLGIVFGLLPLVVSHDRQDAKQGY